MLTVATNLPLMHLCLCSFTQKLTRRFRRTLKKATEEDFGTQNRSTNMAPNSTGHDTKQRYSLPLIGIIAVIAIAVLTLIVVVAILLRRLASRTVKFLLRRVIHLRGRSAIAMITQFARPLIHIKLASRIVKIIGHRFDVGIWRAISCGDHAKRVV